VSTKWCSTDAQKELRIDPGAKYYLTQLTVKHAGTGGELVSRNTRAFTIEVSTDRVDWKQVVAVTDNTDSATQHTIPVTVGQYLKLTVVTPTQDTDLAARIYEVEAHAGSALRTWGQSCLSRREHRMLPRRFRVHITPLNAGFP
jgi:predicted acyl esterase